MYVIAGYTMTYENAKAWALRHYPGIDFYDDDLIPNIIEKHNNRLEDAPQKLRVISCLKSDFCFVVFVTHAVEDPTATRARHKYFRESEADKKLKETFFPDKEDQEKLDFLTICDPLNRWY